MDQEKKAQWVAALRSGEYQQGKGLLHTISNGEHSYCCLGVLCDLAEKAGLELRREDQPERYRDPDVRYIIAYDGFDDFLPVSVQNWAGLDSPNPGTSELVDVHQNGRPIRVTLSWLNDDNRNFSEIADIIERNF